MFYQNSPSVNVFETEGEFVLFADMPGVSRENLKVAVEGKELSIEGKVDLGSPDGARVLYSEHDGSRLARKFVIGKDIDVDKIEAEMKHGVLRLRLPKVESTRPREISVVVN
jgi:HSP20 family protein